MPRIVVLGTGGTIASRFDARTGSAVSAASSAELMAVLRERGFSLPAGIEVESEQFCTVGSYLFDLELAFRIAKRADRLLADPEVAGLVVTQGTDTMEESAYMADLVVRSEKPVVFTGAQRRADESDADGPRNLADAIRVAAAPAAPGLGAVVVFDGEVHAARDVTKLHTSRPGTFYSGDHGKLGDVDGEHVVIRARPLLRRSFHADSVEPAVDLVRLTMGSDARFIRHALESGAKAIVVEAFGRGNANHEVIAGIREAVAAKTPVVVTSRCPQGRVKPIYGDGGGRDVEAAGAIFAGDLQGPKARVLLSVLLRTPDPIDLAATVTELGG
jgi:L-asparaginase